MLLWRDNADQRMAMPSAISLHEGCRRRRGKIDSGEAHPTVPRIFTPSTFISTTLLHRNFNSVPLLCGPTPLFVYCVSDIKRSSAGVLWCNGKGRKLSPSPSAVVLAVRLAHPPPCSPHTSCEALRHPCSPRRGAATHTKAKFSNMWLHDVMAGCAYLLYYCPFDSVAAATAAVFNDLCSAPLLID